MLDICILYALMEGRGTGVAFHQKTMPVSKQKKLNGHTNYMWFDIMQLMGNSRCKYVRRHILE